VFQVILTSRVAYHSAIYGASVDTTSPQYANMISNLGRFISQAAGGTSKDIMSRAAAVFQVNIAKQAFVSGVNDVFIVASATTIGCALLVLLLRPIPELKKEKK
jgi:hypothetical protein